MTICGILKCIGNGFLYCLSAVRFSGGISSIGNHVINTWPRHCLHGLFITWLDNSNPNPIDANSNNIVSQYIEIIEMKSYRERRSRGSCRREGIVSIVIDASHEVMIFIRSGIWTLTHSHKCTDDNCMNKAYKEGHKSIRSIVCGIHLSLTLSNEIGNEMRWIRRYIYV